LTTAVTGNRQYYRMLEGSSYPRSYGRSYGWYGLWPLLNSRLRPRREIAGACRDEKETIMSRTRSAAVSLDCVARRRGQQQPAPIPSFSHPVRPPGPRLTTPPKEIRMNFSEELVAAFFRDRSQEWAAAKPVSHRQSGVSPPATCEKIIVPIPARLAPGTYRVAWHAVFNGHTSRLGTV